MTTLRAATFADLPAVLALWQDADAHPSTTDDLVSVQQLVAHDPEALLVAVDGDRVVGSVVAGWNGWRGSIYRLAVAPAHRRSGLGSRLVAAAQQRLAARGAARLDAIVVSDDAQAAAFWGATGWEPQAQRSRFVRNLEGRGADDLAHRIGARCLVTGEFTLRSGQQATTYFDKFQFQADPALLREVAARLAVLVPADTEVLAGIELGGIPVATALSFATGLPVCMVRKQAKAYGTGKLAEGPDLTGKRVLVVEDVITTGGQVVMSTGDLRALGATVDTVLCVIDRSEGNHPLLTEAGLSLVSLFTADEVA
jgi:orotate phosphoribosyltransferase